MRQSNKLYLYKVDYGEWWWYLAAFVPKERWGETEYLFAPVVGMCHYEGKYCEYFFTPNAWEREIKSLEEVGPLEILVLFGHSIETLKRKIRENR